VISAKAMSPMQTTINVRATAKDLALIDNAAEVEGKTRSAFLRDCAEAAARKVFPVVVGQTCPLCGQHT
jgi:uncharacterized protein (DUF1778 family)